MYTLNIYNIINIYIYIYIIFTIILRINEHQCWAIRHFFNFFLKILIDRFLFLRCGGSLFHLIVDAELNFLLSYLMQWVIGWCSLVELLLRNILVFGLCFILLRKL